MIRFTHHFDLLKSLLLFIFGFGVFMTILILLVFHDYPITPCVIICGIITVAIMIIGDHLLSPVATILYLSTKYNVHLTYKEAKGITFLFDGSLDGKWYPMKELADMDESQRKEYLFTFASGFKRIN